MELARPDYLARLQQEWEEAANNEAGVGKEDEEAEVEEDPGPSTKPLYFPIPGRKRKASGRRAHACTSRHCPSMGGRCLNHASQLMPVCP